MDNLKKYGCSVVLTLCFCSYALSQTVTNVVAEQVGKTVEISYTLDKSTEISIEYSTDGTHYTKLKNVSGDVGRNVQAGKKKIIWDVLAETGGLVKENVRFKIICSITSVTDCQGHTYPVVKIGEQYWMAENLQCTKYDTRSGLSGKILNVSINGVLEPYIVDGRNMYTGYCVESDLSDFQRRHLGLLYNFAAALGLNGTEEYDNMFEYKNKQGICPNGFHIPTQKDWQNLIVASGGENAAGENLKSKTGWFQNNNGEDLYSFNVLPAGDAIGSKSKYSVAGTTHLWTSFSNNNVSANAVVFSFDTDDVKIQRFRKYCAFSVRCVKD